MILTNKIILIVTFFLLFTFIVKAQGKGIGISYSKIVVDKEFNIDKVYYKFSGKKIPRKVFASLTRKNPNLYLEKEYNEQGRVIKYLYDKDNPGVRLVKPKAIAKGNFPSFKFTTVEKNKIVSKNLLGKIIILRFELFVNDFRFKENEIKELDKKINISKNKENIEAVIIFECSEKEIINGFSIPDSNFKLVGNGMNFIQKLGISRFPYTLIIDQQGNLIDKFAFSEDIELDKYFR